MSSNKQEAFAKNYSERMKAGTSASTIDNDLRGREMSDDPMLEYFRQKEKGAKGDLKAIPKFRGHYPPNRFDIRPGHRWDGVDRSNGYERKLIECDIKKKERCRDYNS